ncbi:MAG: bifunctional folylpolyglutamate synthase/dihydrofolate synthase, partial [Proteobacteria bacterium]|nr:bifunctional folylpolyglutamate synthase/dihydrofolate synthase [Pseudomonadota bacterium]
MAKIPATDAILERLLALHPKLVDLSLGRVERILDALGHPERQLPPVVHITGTNGKGSVIAFLRAMLEDAGYRVHVYISPHLTRFHERIRLSGDLISEPELEETLAHCERINAGQSITFFEITTAAAFVAFARTPADIVLLENGLGGRLDATNVVARPLATAITQVSLDHQNFLGDTLAKIAFEKAGIVKAGVPCVLAPQPDEALDVIRAHAAAVPAPLFEYERDWEAVRTLDGLTVRVGGETLNLPAPNLPGPHQTTNAGQAVALALTLDGFELSDANIAAGVANAEWPARLQRLKWGPAIDAVPADWEVWLDGGHNPAAGETVARHGRAAWTDRPLHLVC